MELEEIELEKLYQQAKKFVDAKWHAERATNIRISTLSVMKMLIEIKKIKSDEDKSGTVMTVSKLFIEALKESSKTKTS